MKKKSVFAFGSYKMVMAHMLSGKDNRGQMSRAAEALNCQRSYLSRVITEDLHLTPDHAYNLAKFWRFSPAERDYFLILVEYERAGDHDYRLFLKKRLDDLRKKYESVEERTGRQELSAGTPQVSYFSSWIWSALHFLTSIPKCQDVEKLAARLGTTSEFILPLLSQLQSLGFVELKNGRCKYKSGEFHIPKESPLVVLHHQNWRNRAILDAQNFHNDSIHYTAIQTMSNEDMTKIKDMLLTFISGLAPRLVEIVSRVAGLRFHAVAC